MTDDVKPGDLVRFKLDERERLLGRSSLDEASELYPYKFEIGIVLPNPHAPQGMQVAFPSRTGNFMSHLLEVISSS